MNKAVAKVKIYLHVQWMPEREQPNGHEEAFITPENENTDASESIRWLDLQGEVDTSM